MAEDRPPPLPPQPINYQAPRSPAPPSSDRDGYQHVADTVGMVPSLRWKDNVIQAISIGVGAVVGAAIGYFASGGEALVALVGGIGGLIVALFLSGIVFMIQGLVRARKGKH